MARYSGYRRRGYGRRRFGYSRRRYGFRRGFRRYFTRFRTRYRTMYRTRRRRRGGVSRRPRFTFGQWIWKLALLVLVLFGGVYVWNKYLRNKIVRV